VNKVAAFEMVIKGADAIVSQPVRFEKPIELNRWYDIELRVGMTEIECYLDGKLLMTYTKPRSIFAIAGRDEKTNEVVIKVVNANPTPGNIQIQLQHAGKLASQANVITLASKSEEDENSFENPEQFVPVNSTTAIDGAEFSYKFQPWSLTVLRVKTEQ
jgi:alpha-L-arabinofuranosidase